MSWSANNLAATTTWSTLLALTQHEVPFPSAGAMTMSELAFWNAAASPALREQAARALALQLDSVFRVLRGADYEAGSDVGKATSEIAAVMAEGGTTMEQLADVNDANYRFRGENVG